jgi:hypothetical protein
MLKRLRQYSCYRVPHAPLDLSLPAPAASRTEDATSNALSQYG